MPGLGERRRRLCRFAAQLEPEPEELPYYLQVPRSEEEKAPGWYMHRDGTIVYLGYSAGDAEQELRDLIRAQGKQPTKRRRKAAA